MGVLAAGIGTGPFGALIVGGLAVWWGASNAVTAIAVVVNLTLNLALIPTFGMLGAAAATVTTEAARAAIAGFYARREGYPKTPLSRHWRAVVATAAMGAALVLAGTQPLFVALALGGAVYGIVLTLIGGIGLSGRMPVLRV